MTNFHNSSCLTDPCFTFTNYFMLCGKVLPRSTRSNLLIYKWGTVEGGLVNARYEFSHRMSIAEWTALKPCTQQKQNRSSSLILYIFAHVCEHTHMCIHMNTCSTYRKGGYPLKSWGEYGRVAEMSRREGRVEKSGTIVFQLKILTQLKKNEFTVY